MKRGLRITGGVARGRVLVSSVPAGVRPTSSRVREALFSILGQDLRGRSVLDGFGGTGVLGLEAKSRGASDVLICELSGGAARRIRTNVDALGLDVRIQQGDVTDVLRQARFDIVLLDPPYDQDPAVWVERAAPAVRELLVIEHRSGQPLVDCAFEGLSFDRARAYGDTTLAVFRALETA